MAKRKTSVYLRLVVILLVIALATPIPVMAVTESTVMPRASDYLTSYNAYVAAVGSGKVQIWFHAMGTDDMDEISTLTKNFAKDIIKLP